MIEDDDDALVTMVQGRDQAAFGRLVSRHLTSVHRYLVRLTGSAADADELSQETFLRLWERADRYRPGKVKLATWLHRVAHNLAVDELRRRRPEGPSGAHDVEDDSAGPEATAVLRETSARLDGALHALPASQRAALLLCQVQGFSNRDAATILGVTVRSVESLVARARRSLRDTLQESSETGDRRESRA